MDTDVEVLKPFDDLLHLKAFSGFESPTFVPTGIMASEEEGEWVSDQLAYYKARKFILNDGSFDLTSNTMFITEKMKDDGFKLDNSLQVYKNMHFFPYDFFSPLRYGKVMSSENTYCIHHFAGTWNPPFMRAKRWLMRYVLGEKITASLVKIKKSLKNEKLEI